MKCPACEYVREDSDDTPEWQCPHCKVAYSKINPNQAKQVKASLKQKRQHQINNKKTVEIHCQQCGMLMKKANYNQGNYIGIISALIVFFIGITVLLWFFWTITGVIIGVLLILLSLGIGGKSQKIWKCDTCGFYFNRL